MTEDEFRARFGDAAVNALVTQLRSGQSPEIDPSIFATRLGNAGISVDVIALLNAATDAGLVERISILRCPVPTCRRVIDVDAITNHQCPYCRTDFRETGDDPVEGFVYRSSMAVSRSVPWLIAVHGFNTRGPWQEEFSWRIAHRFKYHAPVLIYKYGLVRLAARVLLRLA